MRLKEIQKILDGINFNEAQLAYDYSSNTFSNINRFKVFLNTIELIPVYETEILQLKESELYETGKDALRLGSSAAININNIATYIINSASSLSLVFNKMLPSSEEDSVNIKLPDPSDFESLLKVMSVVQKSLSQVVVHKDIEGSVKINNWEHGSFWIELILGTQAAVALVSSIAWSAAVVCKKYNENKILEETVRAMNIKNESLEDILNSQKEMTKILIEAEANQVASSHYSEKEPEQIKRLEASIKSFAKLIQEGAEVHPALTAPEKVQNLFPNYKKIDTISSQVKLLEKDSDENYDNDG